MNIHDFASSLYYVGLLIEKWTLLLYMMMLIIIIMCIPMLLLSFAFNISNFVSAASGRPHPVLGVVYPNKGICFGIIAVVIHIKYASRFHILTSTSAIWYISLIRNIPEALTCTCKADNNLHHHRRCRHLHLHRHNAPVAICYWAVVSVSTMFPSLPVLHSFSPRCCLYYNNR